MHILCSRYAAKTEFVASANPIQDYSSFHTRILKKHGNNEILWSTKHKTKHHKRRTEADCYEFNGFTQFSTHKKYGDLT